MFSSCIILYEIICACLIITENGKCHFASDIFLFL